MFNYVIMFIKVQFFKYGLCTALYLVMCVILIKMKRNFNSFELKETTTDAKTAKLQLRIFHSTIATNKIIKKNVESAIELLQIDELRGKTIDLQESAALLRQVSNTCTKRKLRTPSIKRHFLYDAKRKSLYCWIRKAASTSFTKLFSDMSNRRVTQNFYKEVDFLSPKTLDDLQQLANNNTVFKLLVVRHPFQRLVSSYRDRIEDNSKYTAQAWLYARPILYFSRPELFRSNASNGNALQKIFLTDRRLRVVPSFREFLEWLLKQPPNHDDVHWDQYHTHCAACDMSYNFILKLDQYTLGEVNYVLSKLKLDTSKIYLPRLQRTRTGPTDFDVTCRYFSDLTTDMIVRLYERYKTDFEMYNYKPDKYLRCAKTRN